MTGRFFYSNRSGVADEKHGYSAIFEDLDGGIFDDKLGSILSQVAQAVIDYDKKGQVTITLDVSQIGSAHQVEVKHKLAFSKPTQRGTIKQDDTTSTPMHVGTGGAMSFFQEDQATMFGRKGEPLKGDESFPARD